VAIRVAGVACAHPGASPSGGVAAIVVSTTVPVSFAGGAIGRCGVESRRLRAVDVRGELDVAGGLQSSSPRRMAALSAARKVVWMRCKVPR
jgi:hypothetical protein